MKSAALCRLSPRERGRIGDQAARQAAAVRNPGACGRAGASRPLQQGALGPFGLAARGLYRIDRRSDRGQGEARTTDIARRLGVAHPTASKTIARLKREGLARRAALSRHISDRGGRGDGQSACVSATGWWSTSCSPSARRARRRRPTPRASSTMSPPRRCAPSKRSCAAAATAEALLASRPTRNPAGDPGPQRLPPTAPWPWPICASTCCKGAGETRKSPE